MAQWETIADIDGWDDDRFSMLLATIWNGCLVVRNSMVEGSTDEFKSPNDFSNGMMKALFDSFGESTKKKLTAEESRKQAEEQQAKQCRAK